MGASSVTGTGHGSADRNLSEIRPLNETLKLRSRNNLPLFDIINRHYVERSQSGSNYDDSIFRMEFTSENGVDYVWDDSTLIVTHNLGEKYVANITIYDENDYLIVPDEIQPISNNIINIEMETFAPISGTYHLIIMK